MRTLLMVVAIGFGFSVGGAEARIIELPTKNPVMKFQPPKGWGVEETDHGYSMESPDKEATVIIEATGKAGLQALLKENNDWLQKDQKVVFDQASKKEETLTIGETEWKRTTWKVTQADWGPGHVMVGQVDSTPTQRLLVTAWVTLKGEKKYGQVLEDLYGSVMQVGQPTMDMEAEMDKPTKRPETEGKTPMEGAAAPKKAPEKGADPAEPEATGRTRAGGGEPVDAGLLIGMWLGNKYISFYEDGRYGLQKYEGAPMDDKNRTWKLDGNKITWNALGDVFTETIVTLTRTKLVIKDAEGNLQTYKRVGD